MNKTIIININGIVFHIEEDAYEVLKSYMTDVKRHFMDSADSLEITTDIENRLAEMFKEMLARDNKQVIVEADVQAVISQMGTVEDFASADEDVKSSAKNHFAYGTETRRLFRDPDNHLAAGVCAGIANYFDIQAVWVRLAFALTLGFGLFLYIILWIVIPKAVSRADRMAMKGEKLDLQGFARNFEGELKGAQRHFTGLYNEAKPLIYKTRDFAGDFFDHLRNFIKGTGRVLAKLFGVCIMLGCIGFTIFLVVILFMYFAYGRNELFHVFPFSIVNREYSFPFTMGAFLFLALPLIAIMLLAARGVFNRETLSRTVWYTFLVCWIASIFVVVYYTAQVATEFKAGGKFSQTINVKATANNTYHIRLNTVRYLSAEDSARLDIKHGFAGKVILDDENDFEDFDGEGQGGNNVTLNIERSDVPQPVLVESFGARGRTYANALMNAREATYHFEQNDSLLTFDRHMQRESNKPYRGQEVRLTLKMPVNAKLVIDRNIDNILNNIDVWRCQDENKLDHKVAPTFIMTQNGLECKVDTIVAAPANLDTVYHRRKKQ
jgi:phage shock protein PspC (stress-responsive transcriptional regulator)